MDKKLTIYGITFTPEEWANFIAVDGDGEVWQFELHPKEYYGSNGYSYWGSGDGGRGKFLGKTILDGLDWTETCFNFREPEHIDLSEAKPGDRFLDGRATYQQPGTYLAGGKQ